MTPICSDHTLMGIWAHPDDEAYLSAGLMARAAAVGARVVCVVATTGEAGTDDPQRWPPQRLARRRRRELRRALSLVGAEPPQFLGHRDGSCADVSVTDAVAAVSRLFEEVRPTHVVTFGSDGITGHPDHRAVSSWVLGAWVERRARGAAIPELLLAATESRWLEAHRGLHDSIGLFPHGPPRCTEPHEVVARVALDGAELAQKRRVLAAHASQTRPLAATVGEQVYRSWWATESFRSPDPAELAAVAEVSGAAVVSVGA